MNLLLPAAPVAYQKRRCITCHSQSLVAMAAAEARQKGIAINEEMEQANLKQIEAFYKLFGELAMQGDQPGGNIITIGYVMMALAAEKHPFGTISVQMIHVAAALQLPDGMWTPNGVSRAPMEDTLVTATAMGIRSLTAIPAPGYEAEVEEKLGRARQWLLTVNGIRPRIAR